VLYICRKSLVTETRDYGRCRNTNLSLTRCSPVELATATAAANASSAKQATGDVAVIERCKHCAHESF